MDTDNIPKRMATIAELRDPKYTEKSFPGQGGRLLNRAIYGTTSPTMGRRVKVWLQLYVLSKFKK